MAQYTACVLKEPLVVALRCPEQFQTTSTAFLWAPSQRPGGHGLCAEQVTAHDPLKVKTPPHTKKQNKLTIVNLHLEGHSELTMLSQCKLQIPLTCCPLNVSEKNVACRVPNKSAMIGKRSPYVHSFFTFLYASLLHLDILDSSEHC